MLAAMTTANVFGVRPCDPADGRCYSYEIDDWSAKIFLAASGSDDDPIVAKIEIEGPMIVVT